jgi:hypothetical protein
MTTLMIIISTIIAIYLAVMIVSIVKQGKKKKDEE